jgi:hypothetical protein
MLSQCGEQGNEALACLPCFGMVRSKHVLTTCQRTGIQDPGFISIALCLPKPRKIVQ